VLVLDRSVPGGEWLSRDVRDADATPDPVVPADVTSPAELAAEAPGEPWDAPSWDEIVRQHSPRVHRLAYRLTGNRHDADDLTQDVFVRVFRSLASYTPGTFEGWLHRITTNLFLDGVRRKARIRFEALPEDAERVVGNSPSPEKVWHDSHLDAELDRALAALPPDFRAAVVLCDVEQLSYEEVAATLGIKLGTVRSRIHRGRSQLRAALEDSELSRGRRQGASGAVAGASAPAAP
jgi:RNA polymerase sigma factor (sigma-70 family)